MKHRKFTNEKTAVAGVIEALLIIGLVAIVLSYIQFAYIPVIMDQKEADHMDQVSNQFAQLKSTIEVQSMMGTLGTGEPITYTPISSPITLGSKELPYFISARSYGQINLIDQDDAGDYKIDILPAPADFPSGISLTSIKYEAENYYFVDQTYVLEGGGIVLKQPGEGEVMRVNPGISVENNSDVGNIEIRYFIPLFTGIPGKKVHGGWEDCYIHTNYITDYSYSGSATFIRIYTDYPYAWNDSLVNESRGILREYYDNGYINVQLDDTVTPNMVEITPGSKSINIELTIVEVGVQVGPGYIPQ